MALAEPPSLLRMIQVLFPSYLDSVKSMLERSAGHIVNRASAFSKLNPVFASIVIYQICIAVGFIIFCLTAILDLAAETHVLHAIPHAIERLNEHVLPALQLLHGFLALLVGFFILVGRIHINFNVNSNRSRPYPNTVSSTLSRRSKAIRSLPIAKYRCLKKPDYSSPCSICLGCIGEDDEVRILPNCRHYFHIFCIDRWLLPCTVNNSSCPLCRATVIGLRTLQEK